MENIDFEEKACEILHGVEFKDAEAIAKAFYQLANYLREQSRQTAVSGNEVAVCEHERVDSVGGIWICSQCGKSVGGGM